MKKAHKSFVLENGPKVLAELEQKNGIKQKQRRAETLSCSVGHIL